MRVVGFLLFVSFQSIQASQTEVESSLLTDTLYSCLLSLVTLSLWSLSHIPIVVYIYDLVPKGLHENRTKGIENKVDDTLKLVVFLECAQC